MDDPISRIEAALKAEPSAGPWTVLPAIAGEQCVARINALEVVPPTGIELARDFIDAEYIAACNPTALRALLDRLKAAEERLKAKRETECMSLDDWRIRAMNLEAQWGRCSQACARMQGERDRALDRLKEAEAENERVRQIAYDSANSLESISKLAGLAQYMDTMSDIRAYARSRADVARAALESTDAR